MKNLLDKIKYVNNEIDALKNTMKLVEGTRDHKFLNVILERRIQKREEFRWEYLERLKMNQTFHSTFTNN
ncbi:MAG: hypothetical protein Unbinned5607contig1000_50 [Prokaryotic dsDNA virus sp.]|nr:MAG: hypothetical protein Unbinned5607contig1000_50 [Prokaryotic dsDNA virus sp.]